MQDKIRPQGMPQRCAFGEEELEAIKELFSYYQAQQRDFGYQGHYEELYTKKFVEYQQVKEGYADAVCTGTAAVFLAVSALQLPKGAEVIVSPITDPGTITAIIYNQLVPVIADSMKDSYNISVDAIERQITKKTGAILVVHAAGQAASSIIAIQTLAKTRGLFLVEDCSQAHGARHQGRLVGTFGDIAAFSTMYRKAHGTGGCGGVVFSQDQDRFNLALAYADRGKPKWLPGFQEKNPAQFLFPALNLNQDEISCAIGIKTLAKLDSVIQRRNEFVKTLTQYVKESSSLCRVYPMSADDSPFFLPIFVDTARLKCSKIEFANAIAAEGIELNPHYQYIVSEWPWALPYLSGSTACPNATSCRDGSFNILFNERYGLSEAKDIVSAIVKAEKHFSK